MRFSTFLLSGLLVAESALAVPATTTKTTSTSKHSTTTTSTHKTTSSVKTTTSTKKSTSTSKKTSTTTSKTTSTSSKKTSTISTSTKPSTTSTTSKPLTTSTTSKSSTTTTSSTTSKSASPTPVKSNGKRGLAFNNPALTEPWSLSGQGSKVNWAYNWASDPYYGGTYTANSFNKVLTYVPMLWSAATDLTSIWQNNVRNAIATYGTESVLSFNEPDGCCWDCGNSCMNVSEAVSAYKQWVQPFAGTVKLGAPAVTNGVGEGIGISYMQYFMGNCTNCQVDFIPLHWYGSVLDPNSFTTYVESFFQKFNKPIWITEFGTSSGTDAQIISFLQQVMPWLDSQSYVQRYAYFMDTNAGSPYLLNTNDTMTDIGVVFNSG